MGCTKIVKWLECEPKDLYQYRLDKYFYLTRESLPNAMVDMQKFSKEARKILDDLGRVSEGTVGTIIAAMRKLQSSDIDNIFSGLLPRIEASQLKFFVIKELFKLSPVPSENYGIYWKNKTKNSIGRYRPIESNEYSISRRC